MVASSPKLIWHIDLHEQHAGEALGFFWIGFGNEYERQLALDQVKGALREHHVLSYAIWEMLGERDLLIRVFLPQGLDADKVREALGDSLRQLRAADIDYFRVRKTLYHWMHKHPVSVPEYVHVVDPAGSSKLNDTDFPISPGTLSFYKKRYFVLPVETALTLPFFMSVLTPHSSLISERAFDEFLTKLVKTRRPAFSDMALYKGSGIGRLEGSRYLITGRVRPDDWYRLREFLTEEVLKFERHTKTITYIAATPATVRRREQLSDETTKDIFRAPLKPSDLAEILDLDESEGLEFKASAFVDVNKWIHKGVRTETETAFNEVVRTVTGFLNSAAGGRLIIGVIELQRFDKALVEKRNPQAYFASKHAAIGVQLDYRGKGGWDAFSRRLRDRLRSSITPSTPLNTIEIEKIVLGGQDCAVVTVRRPSGWFFAKITDPENGQTGVHFYVREGNRTRVLVGTELIEYSLETPRS